MSNNESVLGEFVPIHRQILLQVFHHKLHARLWDNIHDFSFVMEHDGRIVTSLSPAAHRVPWTTCAGALAHFQALQSAPLDENSEFEIDKGMQCTHLFDLARLAMSYASQVGEHRFEITVNPGVAPGETEAIVKLNGQELLRWIVFKQRVISPGLFLDHVTHGRALWPLESIDPQIRHAALLLRRALLVYFGTRKSRDVKKASELGFMSGACFSFQPENMSVAERPADFLMLSADDIKRD